MHLYFCAQWTVNPSHVACGYIRIADFALKANDDNFRHFIHHQLDKLMRSAQNVRQSAQRGRRKYPRPCQFAVERFLSEFLSFLLHLFVNFIQLLSVIVIIIILFIRENFIVGVLCCHCFYYIEKEILIMAIGICVFNLLLLSN